MDGDVGLAARTRSEWVACDRFRLQSRPVHGRLLILVALAALAACGPSRLRGAKATGDACTEDLECAHGLCVAGVAGDAAVCTVSCATAEECPHGWSCSGVTQRGVLVCSRHAPTPFGGGH